MKISLCIPMYNESSIIKETAQTLHEYMSKTFDDYEIIFSDDGSRDNSAEIVRELDLPRVKVLRYETNMGKGYAVRTAVLSAEGDVVMFTDADLAYGTDVIKQTYDIFSKDESVDMVIGSRPLHKEGYEGYTAIRKLASKIYIKVLSTVGGFKLSDSQCGCKAFTGKAAKEIFPRCEVNRFAFDFECILWAVKMGFNIVEMPVKIINHRESKVNVFRDSFKMLRDLAKMKKRIKNTKL